MTAPETSAGASGGFRRRDALYWHELHFGPNMTPMVDVVMVILVFFMASTAFLGPEWFLRAHAVRQEQTQGAAAVDPSIALPDLRLRVTLSLDESGQTRVRGFGVEDVSLEVFAAAVARTAPDLLAGGAAQPIVIIVPDPSVAYADVVRAHEACAAAGFERVGLR